MKIGIILDVTPYSFQKSAIRKALSHLSLLLIHPTGSGKTVTALLLAKNLIDSGRKGLLIVGPANTLSHYVVLGQRFFPGLKVGILKGPFSAVNDVSLMSYEMAKKHVASIPVGLDLLVFDEIHHCKNCETKNSEMAWQLRAKAKAFVGMTGTPYQNTFFEFSEIVNLVAGDPHYLSNDEFLEFRWDYGKSWFLERWWQVYIVGKPIRGPIVGLKNKDLLRQRILDMVDFLDEETVIRETGRPKAKTNLCYVALAPDEWKKYKVVAGNKKINALKRLDDEQYNEEDIKGVFNGLVHARQALLIPNYCFKDGEKHVSSKIKAISKAIASKRKKCLVFCNFVEFGTECIAKELQQNGIKAASYTGRLTETARKKVMADYRSGSTEALCMSPVGGEGLDIPEAEEIHIVDLHYNPEVVRQMVGRSLRVGSALSEVQVTIYLAHGPNGEKTVDHRIYDIFQKKERLITEIRSLISASPIERFDECAAKG